MARCNDFTPGSSFNLKNIVDFNRPVMGNTAIVNELKGVPMAKSQINNSLALAVEKM